MKSRRYLSMAVLVGAGAVMAASCAGDRTGHRLTVASPDGKNTITIAYPTAATSPTSPGTATTFARRNA
jgi:hypothetical protein